MLFLIGYEQTKAYEENLEASISVLKKLSDDWKEQSVKLSPHEALRETLSNFKQKVRSHSLIYSYLLHLESLINHSDDQTVLFL